MTELQKRYLSEGVCIQCGKRGAVKGRHYCEACIAKHREYGKTWKEAHPEAFREQRRARYHRLKNAGICTVCGKAPALAGRIRCEACAKRGCAYQRAYAERRRREADEDGGEKV